VWCGGIIIRLTNHPPTGYCYTGIGRELWGGGDHLLSMSENTVRQPAIARAVEKKRKIVKMSLIVVILFVVCWLPYHVYFILVFFIPGLCTSSSSITFEIVCCCSTHFSVICFVSTPFFRGGLL
jgi:hypothetical protein